MKTEDLQSGIIGRKIIGPHMFYEILIRSLFKFFSKLMIALVSLETRTEYVFHYGGCPAQEKVWNNFIRGILTDLTCLDFYL